MRRLHRKNCRHRPSQPQREQKYNLLITALLGDSLFRSRANLFTILYFLQLGEVTVLGQVEEAVPFPLDFDEQTVTSIRLMNHEPMKTHLRLMCSSQSGLVRVVGTMLPEVGKEVAQEGAEEVPKPHFEQIPGAERQEGAYAKLELEGDVPEVFL